MTGVTQAIADGKETVLPSPQQESTPGIPTAYAFNIQQGQLNTGLKVVRVVITFVEPPHLAGVEYASFMMPYHEAGVFARKIEAARKHCKK